MSMYRDKSAVWWGVCTTIVLAVCGLLVFGCATGCGKNYSEGFRAGVVTKMSKKGLIWDSYEGQMLTGGMSGGEGGTMMVPVQFDFSAEDGAVVKDLEVVALSGERVRLHYRQWLIGPIWLETKYVAQKVEREQPKVEVPR